MTPEQMLHDALDLASQSLGTAAEHRVFHWIDRYLAGIDRWPQIDRMNDELSAPLPHDPAGHSDHEAG